MIVIPSVDFGITLSLDWLDRRFKKTTVSSEKAFRASLVVMGAYGHSRFREFIFGGATRAMLAEMRAPVLMAH